MGQLKVPRRYELYMFLQKSSENPVGGQGRDEWTQVGGTGVFSRYSLQGARLYNYSSWWWSLLSCLHGKLSQPPLADRPTDTYLY